LGCCSIAAWVFLAARVPAAEPAPVAARNITLAGRYLHLPVKNGAPKRVVSFEVDGTKVREFTIEYAAAAPDFWVFAEVAAWRGRNLRVTAEGLSAGALERLEQSDALKDAGSLYVEPLRPQFHFSSRRGWNNDPNGLLYYEGEYHLFYQHNPYGWAHGNMTWGHATSRDLVRWAEQGDVLHPDALGTMYSGSGVVDWRNTSGLGTGGRPPLVLIYTAAGGTNPWSKGQPFTQCLAYSNDAGRTWTKYAGNPVLGERTRGNRDPKVFWHEPGRHWVMVLYAGYPQAGKNDAKGKPVVIHTIEFFASPNLREWTYLSRLEGFYECPDLFELPVDGDAKNTRWVIHGANSDYMVGRFDGKTFAPETPLLKGHRGDAFYAPQTFSDMPDGRRVQIGWGRVPMPGMPFNQQMLFPCELSLRGTPEGPRLAWQPVRELATLRGKVHRIAPGILAPGANPLAGVRLREFEIEADLEAGDAREVGFVLRGVPVVYDVRRQELTVAKATAPVPLEDGRLRLHLLADRRSLEIFGRRGIAYLPLKIAPAPDDATLEVFARGGNAVVRSLEVREIDSIWPPARR
jgi:fructan beta-fructosidase